MSERTNAVMLANPTMASTAPLAGLRSPRRARGLNSGSMRLASLTKRSSCSRCCDFLLERGSLRTASSSTTRFCSMQRVQGLQVDEQHAAFERRQRAALQSRAAGEIDVERRRRRGLQRRGAAAGTIPRAARRSIRSASARGCRGRRASGPGSSGTGARSSSGPPIASSRSGSRSMRSAQARVNGVKSSVHFAADQRSQR